MRSFAYAATLVLAVGIVVKIASWLFSDGSAPRGAGEAVTQSESGGEQRQGSLVGPQITPDIDREPHGGPRSGLHQDQLAVFEASPWISRDLAPRGTLLFAIRDMLDGPVPGVRVSLGSGSRQRSAVTGRGGEAAFEHLVAGRYAYRVEAPARPVLAAAGPIALRAGELRSLELRLGEFDRLVAGRVVDQDGVPVAGLVVRARLYRPPIDPSVLVPQSQAEQRAETAADGGFEIAGLMAGEYEVRTIATDRYRAAKAIVRAGTDAAFLTVVERQEVTVFGQVTSTAGEPLADVRVVHLRQPSRRARTDGDGWYELAVATREGQPPRLRFDLSGYQGERIALHEDAVRGSSDVRVDATLSPFDNSVEVSVRLANGESAPVVGERVYLHSATRRTHYQAVSGVGGRARFAEVAASADYRVWVAPRGPYKDYARSVDLSEGVVLDIELEALAVGTLSGHMIDPAGEPVPRFSLRVHSSDARGQWRQVSGDADGYFEAEVPAGSLTLQSVSTPQFHIRGVDVDVGADAYALLMLDWGEAMLEGRVLDASGDPLPGADVGLYWIRNEGPVHSRSSRRTVTDARGAFVFSRVGRAPHRLEVAAAGHGGYQQTLKPGAEWVEVRLASGEE